MLAYHLRGECWDGLDDSRTGNTALYDLNEILAIAMCAILCGGQRSVDMGLCVQSKEMILRGYLKRENGVPSYEMFSRILSILDTERFRADFQRFMVGFAEQYEGVVEIDGKVLSRSFDSASGKSPLHMVAADVESNASCWRRSPPSEVKRNRRRTETIGNAEAERDDRDADVLNCQRAIASRSSIRASNMHWP